MEGKRLQRDLLEIQKDPPPGISAEVFGDDISEWDAIITGPADTPFAEGAFKVRIKFPPDYPYQPPVIVFYSRMFHPNVFPNGKVCLHTCDWSPAFDASVMLSAVQYMLGDADVGTESPANCEASKLFQMDKASYMARAKDIVKMSKLVGGNVNLNEEDVKNEIIARVNDLVLFKSEHEDNIDDIKKFLKS